MRLPSLNHMLSQAMTTVRRFPAEILVALIGTIVAMRFAYVESHGGLTTAQELDFVHPMLSCILLLNVALALSIAREAGRISELVRWILFVAIGGTLTWFTYGMINADWSIQLYLASALMVHGGVALSGAWNRSRRGFWEFNKTLFLRTLTGALFTGVLMGGVSLALVSLDALFEVEVREWMYAWVVSVLLGVFNTLFVLGGVPRTPVVYDAESVATADAATAYPKGLRIFTQFVLLPLVVIFLCILYAYGVKVLFFASLKGSVTGFILALSIVGILGYLLVYPLRKDSEHGWIALFARWFGRLMVPLCAMLWVAIWVRVDAYGITEERYAVILLGACLTIISVYLAVWRDPDLRVIPVTLVLASLIAFVGPLNMSAVSVRSQTTRAETILEQYGALKSGGYDSTAAKKIPDSAAAVVYSVVHYMTDYTDSTRLKTWLSSMGLSSAADLNVGQYAGSTNITSVYLERRALTLALDYKATPKVAWVSNGTVQRFSITDISRRDSPGRDPYDDDSLVFYDGGKWVVRFIEGETLLWIVSDPAGNLDTLDVQSGLTLRGEAEGHTYAMGEYIKTAEFPKHNVRFAFDSFGADFEDGNWVDFRASGMIIIEHK